MKLREYLDKKYLNKAYALTRLQALSLEIPFPLIRGWPEKYCDMEVDEASLEALSRKRKVDAPERKKTKLERKKARQERKQAKQLVRRVHYAATDEFLSSYEWRKVRMQVLSKYGTRCQCCGATPEDGVRMHVDHIRPRKVFPELALDLNNLQVLCEACNHGKGNWDMTDWRGNAPYRTGVIDAETKQAFDRWMADEDPPQKRH